MIYDFWWQILLLAVAAYFFGNINSSIIITKCNKKDVRKMGSGNPGTMNMLRNMGAGWGFVTLILDILKGVIPCLVGKLVFSTLYPNVEGFDVGDMALYVAGFSVVLGHIYPALMKFKGGKGVATTFGVFFVGQPIVMTIALFVCIGFICVFEYGSLGSFIGLAMVAICEGIELSSKYFTSGVLTVPLGLYLTTVLAVFATVFMVLFAHRKNIYGLIAGTEHKTQLIPIIAKFLKKGKKRKGE